MLKNTKKNIVLKNTKKKYCVKKYKKIVLKILVLKNPRKSC